MLVMGNGQAEFMWCRYGGVESDATLDVFSYNVSIKFPRIDETTFGDVKLSLAYHLKLSIPGSVYIVDWGDGSEPNIQFSEELGRFNHTYNSNTLTKEFRIIVKGHNLHTNIYNELDVGDVIKTDTVYIDDPAFLDREFTITVKKGELNNED